MFSSSRRPSDLVRDPEKLRVGFAKVRLVLAFGSDPTALRRRHRELYSTRMGNLCSGSDLRGRVFATARHFSAVEKVRSPYPFSRPKVYESILRAHRRRSSDDSVRFPATFWRFRRKVVASKPQKNATGATSIHRKTTRMTKIQQPYYNLRVETDYHSLWWSYITRWSRESISY